MQLKKVSFLCVQPFIEDNATILVLNNIEVVNRTESFPLICKKTVNNTKKNVLYETNNQRVLTEKKSKKKLKREQLNTPQIPKTISKQYYLNLSPLKSYGRPSFLKINFFSLCDNLHNLKLPDNWNLNVFLTDCKITAIVLKDNYRMKYRGVAFFSHTPFYKVIVEGVHVDLLGCPSSIKSLEDIHVLIKIVSKIRLDDCMCRVVEVLQ